MQSMINVIQYLEFLSLATQEEWTCLLITPWFTVTGPMNRAFNNPPSASLLHNVGLPVLCPARQNIQKTPQSFQLIFGFF